MKQHLNTLFITTQGAYLGKEGEAIEVTVDRERLARIPVITLAGIICFGRVSLSPAAMGMCAERGIGVTFLTERGRYLAQVNGMTSGNVLLRREQYRRAERHEGGVEFVRAIVAAKIANARAVLLRAVRDHGSGDAGSGLVAAAQRLAANASRVRSAPTIDMARGIEGESAAVYFGTFDGMIVAQRDGFSFAKRSRRPPLDRVNALLSFVYTLLVHDLRAACEATGLDSAVGYLHRDRPGRPGLALDLMEEFRAVLADRLVLSLINRQQVRADGFTTLEGGAVVMDDATRKTVLVAYQERKQDTVVHPFIGEKTTVGLLPYLQARLFARYLRGDLDGYPPYIWR